MRIAFLADSYLRDDSTGVNGTQVQMHNLAVEFARRAIEVHYISLTGNRGRGLPEDNGVRFHWIERGCGPMAWVGELGAFRRILDEVDPDVVYQRGRSHLTFVAARWARAHGRRFVWGSNGEDSGERWKLTRRLGRSRRPLWKKPLLWPLMVVRDVLIHRGVEGATGIVAQTWHQSGALRGNYGKRSVVLPSFFPAPERDTVRCPEREVLWMASLAPAKRPELFLDLAEAFAGNAGWRFVLAGGTADAAYERGIARRASALPNVELLGAVPFADTDTYYARASLFVNTSLPEADGLPNAFIQAWLHGTPVLSLHHDPNGWITRHGLGFSARGDAATFLRAGEAFLSGAAGGARMRAACRDFARETFANPETIDAYLELFTDD